MKCYIRGRYEHSREGKQAEGRSKQSKCLGVVIIHAYTRIHVSSYCVRVSPPVVTHHEQGILYMGFWLTPPLSSNILASEAPVFRGAVSQPTAVSRRFPSIFVRLVGHKVDENGGKTAQVVTRPKSQVSRKLSAADRQHLPCQVSNTSTFSNAPSHCATATRICSSSALLSLCVVTAAVESDFSSLRRAKTDYRGNLSCMALEGAMQASDLLMIADKVSAPFSFPRV
jgi:hypothetical protein